MNLNETVINGTIRPDGSLSLDGPTNLPAGRVTVVLRRECDAENPPAVDWWQHMQRSRGELEAAGTAFMNEAEVEAHLERLRESDPIDELLRRQDPA